MRRLNMKKLGNMSELRRQRGADLVVSLVVLLVVTLMGLGALETAVFQERMAANAQNKNVAFQDTASLLEDILRDENVLGGGVATLHNAIVRGVGEPGNPTNYNAVSPVAAEYVVTYMGEDSPFVGEEIGRASCRERV